MTLNFTINPSAILRESCLLQQVWAVIKKVLFFLGLVLGSWALAYLSLFHDVLFTAIIMVILVVASINWSFVSVILLVAMAVMQVGLWSETLEFFRPFFLISGASLISWYLQFATKKCRHFTRSPQLLLVLVLFFAETFSTIRIGWAAYTVETFMFWLKIVIIFFLVANLTTNIIQLRLVLWITVLSAVVVGTIAMHTYFYEPEKLIAGRLAAYGVYDNPNDLALLMVMTWPLAFKLFEADRSALVKVFLGFILAIITIVLLLTLSRGGLLGLLVVGLLCLWTSPKLTKKQKLLVIIPGTLLALALVPLVLSQRGEESGFSAEDESASHRLLVWEAGGRMLLSTHTGIGFELFIDNSGDFDGPPNLQAHNTPVKVAAEAGWLALFSYLGMIFLTMKHLLFLEDDLKKAKIFELTQEVQALRISLTGFLVNTSFSVKEYEWALYIVLGLSLAAREIYRNIVPTPTERSNLIA
ncbi:O-antigen ligase family protein [candidate division KSB1 bacterium]|nr:O-antigen ligase family protein [candidate division KSB1 bacterium]